MAQSLCRLFGDLDLGPIKAKVREDVWAKMDGGYLNPYPPSCSGKIPNFRGSRFAAERLSKTSEFGRAKVIKVNPSLAQIHLRTLVLDRGKTLVVPAPQLSPNHPNGGGEFMYLIEESDPRRIRRAVTKRGAAKLGREMLLDGWDGIKIDLYVVAAVAVTAQGVRLGKGRGFGDLEWAILVDVGVVDPRTTIVATTVHENQIVDANSLPVESTMTPHDLPVDVIVTPKRIINVKKKLSKPECGVIWDLVTEQMLKDVPILSRLRNSDIVRHEK